MKTNRNLLRSLTVAALIAGLGIMSTGCQQQSPMAADSSKNAPKFLKIINSGPSLKKIISSSKTINKLTGGTVKLEYEADDGDIEFEVEISLQILPGALSDDVEISLSIDDQDFASYMDVTFAPHGTVFNVPAILNIDVEDVDLTGVDISTLGVYYDNEDTGEWELMEFDDIQVDPSEGEVRVINAKLPHFSRYAIGGN